MVRRRAILKSAVALAAGQWVRPEFAAAAPTASAPPSQAFDYAWLKGQARKLAGNAYQASQDTLPPALGMNGYDLYQSLRFCTDHALRANAALALCLLFFH